MGTEHYGREVGRVSCFTNGPSAGPSELRVVGGAEQTRPTRFAWFDFSLPKRPLINPATQRKFQEYVVRPEWGNLHLAVLEQALLQVAAAFYGIDERAHLATQNSMADRR